MKEDSLGLTRFLMVLSSFSPLFLIWAVRGSNLINDYVHSVVCLMLAFLPSLVLYWRVRVAKKQSQNNDLVVSNAEDHRSHLLIYLFAMMLPFIGNDPDSWRELASLVMAFIFVVYIFWHMNLHYMNIWFALFGYRVYTFSSPEDGNLISGKHKRVLITKRSHIDEGIALTALRLSNSVYMEVGK